MAKPTLYFEEKATRITVFGSFYRGYYVLSELLHGALKDRVQVVGVCSDDPSQTYVHPSVRVWQYPHETYEETMVRDLATQHQIPTYCGSVKTEAFRDLFEQLWKPDLCIMATFGQRIPPSIFTQPPLGFFNLHPCAGNVWPSLFAGSNPFKALMESQLDHVQIAMHRIDSNFDAGDLIAFSDSIAIPPHASVIDLHKITSKTAAVFAAKQIKVILDRVKTP